MNSYIAIALVLVIAVAQVQSQGNRQPDQRTLNNNKKPMWKKPNAAQAPPTSNSAYGFASMLNNPVAMSMFLSGNMPDTLQDMMQMNMAGNLLGGRGMGRGFGLRQLAALSFLEGMSK